VCHSVMNRVLTTRFIAVALGEWKDYSNFVNMLQDQKNMETRISLDSGECGRYNGGQRWIGHPWLDSIAGR
jgi:hypothetical protein